MAPKIEIAGQELVLLPERAIYWVERKWVLLADVHLGKATHFRKHGAAVPSGEGNFLKMASLIRTWQPTEVVILGDLFHSARNKAWDRFCEFTALQTPAFTLIKGNHDFLGEKDYADARLQVWNESLEADGLVLRHEPSVGDQTQGYELAGHLHPGVRLEGPGRQRLRLPCFVFGAKQGLLPAFGEFTGLAIVEPLEQDRVFAIAEKEVLEIQ